MDRRESFRQRYKYWKETGELPYSNGLKRELSNQAQPEDSPVKSGIPYPKYDGGKDGLFIKYVDSYRVNPDTGGVYDKVGEVKEGAVILPEVEVVGKPTGIEAVRREYNRMADIQRRQGLSGADPIGQFAVETAALNPVFKLAGTAGLYGLGRYGESLTGFARPQNWARAKLITREMQPLQGYKGQWAARIIGDEYNSDSFFNPNSYYHVENNTLNRSKFPILTPRDSQSPAIWLQKGRPWLGDNSRTIYELPGSSSVRSSGEIDNEFANYFLSDKIDLTDPQLTAYKRIRGLRPGESWLGRMKYYTPTPQRNIRSIEWPVGRTAPQMTAENASSITPEQWTALQDAAIARGDMAEAQRLRDLHFVVKTPNNVVVKDGMPTHNYHGTDVNFNEFDIRKFGRTDDGDRGMGFYFSENPKISGTYGPIIQDDYLYAKTPYKGYDSNERYLGRGLSKQQVIDELIEREIRYRDNKVKSFIEQQKGLKGKSRAYEKLGITENTPKEEIEKLVFENYNIDNTIPHLVGNLEEADVFLSPYENVVYKPNQIKSAKAVTYDDKGVRIPLGERDNFSINDIRYGLLPFLGLGTTGSSYGTFNRRR